jgi:integrase
MPKTRTGHVFEKDGSWYARFDYTDSTGRRRNVKRHAVNKTEAKNLLKQLLKEYDEGGETLFQSAHLTLTEYLDNWLRAAANPRVSVRTLEDYEDIVRLYIKPSIGKKRLSALTPIEIQALYAALLERGLSARRVRYTHAVLSSALKQAVKWGMLTRNPASLVDLPKQSRKEMKALSPDDAARFLDAASGDRWGLIYLLALITGMRPEEYLGLQWKDIDAERGIITVQRALCWRRRGGGWYFGEPKTAKSRRSIPIPFSVIQRLKDHKRHQGEERLKAGPKYQNFDLVFATPAGGPLMQQNLLRRHFKPILRRAGLPESLTPYSLRHSCATLLLAQNENPKVVSERLGHATVTLTLDTYSHVLPSMQQAATEKLERLLLPQSEVGTKG